MISLTHHSSTLIASIIAIATTLFPACSDKVIYTDSTQPIDQRVEDLLSRMTLDEKVGQMNQMCGLELIRQSEATLTEEELLAHNALGFYPGYTSDDIAEMTRQGLVGSYLHVVTLKEANYLQSLAMESRLHIPLIISIDAIHGNAKVSGCTVYPTNIGLACSFDTAMAYRIARETADEMRACNMQWTFNPNVEVARDPRWGRVGETFGEDPMLVGDLGAASVHGYEDGNVLACIKHFVGGGQPVNGSNGAPCDVSERTLREIFLPPFKKGVQAGASTLMPAHNELAGVPCHTNQYLLQDILHKEWGWDGIIVSDWLDIERVAELHHTAADIQDAYRQSIEAGMDVHMHGPEWQKAVVELVQSGRISEKRIDESVRRILTQKFRLGLFEKPYVTEEEHDAVCYCPKHQATAIEAARNSIVLLKNDGILPLSTLNPQPSTIMVTGINANDENIMGDWSEPQPQENLFTVLRGLKEQAPNIKFDFIDQGWDPRNMDPKQVTLAAEHAKKADLNIVVCGEYMMRYRWTERTGGEDTDRSDNQLVGLQEELIKRVAASGKPTILIFITGRPLGFAWAQENINAILYAWEPGAFGGKAIAEIIFGAVNPSAKLAVSIPYTVGQCQMVYNHKASNAFHPYACNQPIEPLYAFGQGLSYTTFEYANARVENNTLLVDLTNSGSRAGTEITQFYVRDDVSSASRPVKELKGYCRTTLNPGETKTLSFELTDETFAYYDIHMHYGVEPGTFTLYVGGSSLGKDLLTVNYEVK